MPLLKQGSSGPDVTELQQKLKDLGFDPNGVDGNFGPGTRDAVIAFQQSKGLQADGIAGPATLAALGLGDGQPNADTTSPASTDTSADTASTDSASPADTDAAAALNLGGLTGKLPAAVIAQIPDTAKEFGITTNLRLAHFLAQPALDANAAAATFAAKPPRCNARAALSPQHHSTHAPAPSTIRPLSYISKRAP